MSLSYWLSANLDFPFLQVRPRKQQQWATPRSHRRLSSSPALAILGNLCKKRASTEAFLHLLPLLTAWRFREPWAGDGAYILGIITLTALMDFLPWICLNYFFKQFVLLSSKHPRATKSKILHEPAMVCAESMFGFANYILWSNKLYSFSLYFLFSNWIMPFIFVKF